MKKIEERVESLEKIMLGIYNSVRRLEALQGVNEPPAEWNISRDRVIELMESEGCSWEEAEQRLIISMGEVDEI